MRLIDKYILYSSIFALFTEAFKLEYIIQWKLFYLILVVNFCILSIKNKIFLHKNIVFILGFFFLHGLLMYVLYDNPITSLFSQLLGVGLSSIYYYSFLKVYGTKLVFNVYVNFAFVIAVLAIPMYLFNIASFDPNRLNGILSEPAHYAVIMLPAMYFYLKEKHTFRFIVILITILLSKSFLGFLGVFLVFTLPMLKIKYLFKYLVLFIVVLFLIIGFFYKNWDRNLSDVSGNDLTYKIILRVKQTYESLETINTGKFKPNTNVSSYAIISNTYIAKRNFIENPFGTGLGSYKPQYEKYFKDIIPPPYIKTIKLERINSQDAASLFLRFMAELGIFAIIFLLIFIFKGVKVMRQDNIPRQGVLFYLIIKILREGHYFPPEFYFLLLIFLKDFDEHPTYTRRLLNI
ncbi:O-antigen ligase family protein [Flavivirga abyssicola]|uniref:O-antigen ligase family protein n=1 Tax=Flavivirga abyssicola TaxID=3063533 RepID=UPI0026E0C912|nr:O-antigen ligase family protein [Flavivirga sp. MEBiC07777]WVK14791.1 O-antigen ligase family protein [Flavivirga sp. MEBiC07777]